MILLVLPVFIAVVAAVSVVMRRPVAQEWPTCMACGRRFIRVQALGWHIAASHPVDAEEVTVASRVDVVAP